MSIFQWRKIDLEINKEGILYKNVVKNRRKLLAIFVLVIICFVWFTVTIYPYLAKRAGGASPLDTERFQGSDSVVIGPSFTIDDNSKARIYGFADSRTSYWQDHRYYFSVKSENLEYSGLSYTRGGEVLSDVTDTEIDPVAVSIYYANVGDRIVTVMSLPEQDIESLPELKGIFVKSSPFILKHLSENIAQEREISAYTLDVRGIEMSAESSDIAIWVLLIALIIYLGIKLVRYYKNPLKHPTYKQLEKYGDVLEIVEDIELQLQNDVVSIEDNQIVTADWIVTEQSFKKLIQKNHTSKGKFKYTPND